MTTFPSSLRRPIVKSQTIGYKHSPLETPQPTEWNEYTPDQSGNSYIDPIEIHEPCEADAMTASDIDHVTIQQCLLEAHVVHEHDHVHYIYGSERGVHEDNVRRSMGDWMRRHGAREYIEGFWMLRTPYMELRVVAQVGKPETGVVIELRDFNRFTTPSPVSALLVSQGGAA